MIEGGKGRANAGQFPYHPPNLRNMDMGGYTWYMNLHQLMGNVYSVGTGGLLALPFILPTPIRAKALAFSCDGLGVESQMLAGFYANYDRQGDFWCWPYPYNRIWTSDAKTFSAGSWNEWSGLDIYLPANRLLWLVSWMYGSNETLEYHRYNINFFGGVGYPSCVGMKEADLGYAPYNVMGISPGVSFPSELPDPFYQVGPGSVWGAGGDPAFWIQIQ